MKKYITVAILLYLLMISSMVLAASASTINYQAYLASDQGIPVSGFTNITFRLYTTEAGGSFIWEETQLINVDKGLFNVELGSTFTSPLPLNLTDPMNPFHGPLFLGIQVESDGEMVPRKQLTFTSFAVKSEDANTLEGLRASDLDEMDELNNHAALPHVHHIAYSDMDALAAMGAKDDANAYHHDKTAAFTEIQGQISDNQIPASISRDSELTDHQIVGNAHHNKYTDAEAVAAVKNSDGPGSDINADLLDGLHASAFMAANKDDWINSNGDTMYGDFRVSGGGKIGVGLDFSLAGNPLQLSVGSVNDPLLNGISFWEFTDFGMKLGYDGTGAGFENMLRIYDVSNVPVVSVNSIGLSVGGDYIPGETIDSVGSFRLRDASLHNLLTAKSSGIEIGGNYSGTPATTVWGSMILKNNDIPSTDEITISSHEPRIVFNDIGAGGSRNRMSFLKNHAMFDSDDRSNQHFEFYSTFAKTRLYDARLVIHGKAADSWGYGLALTHDGTDGIVSTDVGDILFSPAANVGIGTSEPETQFHVSQSNSTGSGITGHVALVENSYNSNNSDLLALRIGYTGTMAASNNFITFFNGNNAGIGAVEGNNAGGVTFKTSGADFAEWLEKFSHEDELQPGDVVGVKQGKVSRNTKNADRIMVVSSNPSISANSPGENELNTHALIAFIGQVHVNVKGRVHSGDLIIPSGKHDGIAIAVASDAVGEEDVAKIIGQAWQNKDDETAGKVLVAVGLSQNNTGLQLLSSKLEKQNEFIVSQSQIIKTQNEEIADLKAQLIKVNHIVDRLNQLELQLTGARLEKTMQVASADE